MSKRKIRKLRHRTDQNQILSFKQLVEMGNTRARLAKGEITPEQIPPWMTGEAPINQQAMTSEVAEKIGLDPAIEHGHVHGERCHHD